MKVREVAILRALVRQLSKSQVHPTPGGSIISQIGSSNRTAYTLHTRSPAIVSSIFPAFSNVLATPSVASVEGWQRQTPVTHVHHGIPEKVALQSTQPVYHSSLHGVRGIPDLGGTDVSDAPANACLTYSFPRILTCFAVADCKMSGKISAEQIVSE